MSHQELLLETLKALGVSDSMAASIELSVASDYPPIPLRDFDYSAADGNRYDGAPDAGHQIVGHGRTAEAAIRDFAEQFADEFGAEEYEAAA